VFYKSRQVAKILGIPYTRLMSLLRCEKLPAPQKDSSGDYVWLEQDVANARTGLKLGYRRRKVVSHAEA
jgi:hypothetical protein